MAIYLVPVAGGKRVTIDKAVLFLGRHPDCDVVLNKSRKVSRKHCCVAQVNNTFFIRDLGSMNGVRLNGKRVKRVAQIHLGDELTVGDVRYKLLSETQARKVQPITPQDIQPMDISDLPVRGMGVAVPPPLTPKMPVDISQDQPIAIPDDDNSDEIIIDDGEDSSSDDVILLDSSDDI